MKPTIKNRRFHRGAWRIRTAVAGFADQRLSHSSKAPLFSVATSVLLNCDAKILLFCKPANFSE